MWDLLLLYVRVKFETAHCQPVISVTRNKSDKSEFIPEHKLNVNAFGKNCHETSISRILCPCFDQLVFVIAWPSLLLRNRWPSSNEHHRNAVLSFRKSYLKQNHIVSTSSFLLQFLSFEVNFGLVEFKSVGPLAMKGESIWSILMLFAKYCLPGLSHILLLVQHIFLYMSGTGESCFCKCLYAGLFVSILYYHRIYVAWSV